MRTTEPGPATTTKHPPSVTKALWLYLGYLAVFFSAWTFNGVDYLRIGESAQTTKLWYAIPTLLGGAFLVVALSMLGWWRAALFEARRSGPPWVAVLPAAIMVIILINFARLETTRLSPELLLWSTLGAVGVGFGEEMITRGSMVVGLRSRFPEVKVWLFSTLLFSALHMPNVLFGLPLWQMPFQLLLTFILGSGLYAIRRTTGTLVVPMVLHGLWDSALFLGAATGASPSSAQFAVYPLSIACVIGVLMADRRRR